MDYTHRTYKFKLRLNTKQTRCINEWIGTCRFVYNLALETRQWRYIQQKSYLGFAELCRQMPQLRADVDWIKSVPASSLIDVLERQERAYKVFFKGGGFPKYAIKGKYNSITFKSVSVVSDNKIKLQKIGVVKYFSSRNFCGEVRRATIIKEHDGYYINILTRQESNPSPHPNHDSQVGIDMGIALFLSLSTGEKVDNPKVFDQYYNQLRIAQRSLSRKVKGSKHWYNQKRIVNRLYSKIYRTRLDFIHKHSYALAKQYKLVAVENLKIANMVQCGHIGKHILNAGWGEFFTQLKYKCDYYGGQLVRVDPKYTSQTCNDCGCVDKKSRLSQSKFVCTECGAESNADVNAAKNILARAIANVRERESIG